MGQYNLGSLNSQGSAIKVVSAGDPPTLILNHSTKNTVLLGATNAVGSGNLLDATPLDPYASVVVNGVTDVWAVAQSANEPATVYTYQNAVNWTPKAVQPNIADLNSPWEPGVGIASIQLTPPPEAQGLLVNWTTGSGFTILQVTGEQTGIVYYQGNPSLLSETSVWIPVITDLDTTIQVSVQTSIAPKLTLVWLMNPFAAGLVDSGQYGEVNVVGFNLPPSVSVPVSPESGSVFEVQQTDPNMFAKSCAIINATLAAGASKVIVSATAGKAVYLHSLRIEPVSAGTLDINLQDTNGNGFGMVYQAEVGTPTNTDRPAVGVNEFHGFPIGGGSSGLGFQLENAGATSMQVVGYVTYTHA